MKSLVVAGLLFLVAMPAIAQDTFEDERLSCRLISAAEAVRPGSAVQVAVEFTLQPGWHLYWENPGDSGMPPEVTWELPEGVTCIALEMPIPKRIEASGLVSFGYEGSLILSFELTVPETVVPGSEIDLSAQVSWLVCHEICIAGKAPLTLSLPVEGAEKPDKAAAARIAASRFRGVPVSIPIATGDGAITVSGLTDSGVTAVIYYPSEGDMLAAAGAKSVDVDGDSVTIGLWFDKDRPKRLTGLLVLVHTSKPPMAIRLDLALNGSQNEKK